jgi:hypothetical protein
LSQPKKGSTVGQQPRTHVAAVDDVVRTTQSPADFLPDSLQDVLGVAARHFSSCCSTAARRRVFFDGDGQSGGDPAFESLVTLLPYGVDGAGSRRRWWWLSCAVLFSAPP